MAISEGPMTLTKLIDEVSDVLHGYVRSQESKTSLTGSITDVATTFNVADQNSVSPGLVEIEDELVYVTMVDTNTGAVTIAPWGRAQSQTEAVAHSANAKVVNNPLFPRQRIRNALWGVIREVFPDVYAVGEAFFTVVPVKTNYVMPSDCHHVLQAQWLAPGASGLWVEAGRWKQNKRAGDPVELELFSGAWPGANRLRVQYVKNPPATLGQSDDLSTYGYDNQVHDLFVMGATARCIGYVEPSRISLESVVNVAKAETTPPGSATNIAKYLDALFKRRLQDERDGQLLRHPPQMHFTR